VSQVRRLLDTTPRTHASAAGRIAALGSLLKGQASRRIGWGVADQAMSSLSNFAVSIYIARTLGATQFGAFSLCYVTYSYCLNASRGLATDPLMVRFSGTDLPTWRRAVANCTGTSAVTGLAAGTCVLAAAVVLHGTARLAFLALGLTLPGLLLQDSWRYSFFALGRGSQAFLNDTIWTVALLPALALLRLTGHANVFWFVLAWGATATVAAAVGPLQARVIPRLTGAWQWLSRHRDLGPRYFAELTSQSAAFQLRTYGIALLLGLAAVGYVQAAVTLMGPFQVIFFGITLIMVAEAARILRDSPRFLPLFCLVLSAGLTAGALAWGVFLLVALPRGLGSWLLGPIWRPTYPLVVPQIFYAMGLGACAGAGAGLKALGAARRSLRGTVAASIAYLVFGLVGALRGGAFGTVVGTAVAIWLGALLWWWQLCMSLRDAGYGPADGPFWSALLTWRDENAHRGSRPGGVRRFKRSEHRRWLGGQSYHRRPLAAHMGRAEYPYAGRFNLMNGREDGMKVASVESGRFEPTVFGAMSRYRIMVAAFAVLGLVAAIGYTKYSGKTYRAQASITVPIPQSEQGQDPAQYLDSQVLLLQSQQVAQRAAQIADTSLHGSGLSAQDFSTNGGSVKITPPAGAAPGVYGVSITAVSFTSSSPEAAQVGANALLQAFIDVRSATLAAQFRAAVAGIDTMISATSDPTQRASLISQRTQALINEQADLAQQPTVDWAAEPTKPATGGLKQTAVIGLVIGLLLGCAAAYARALRQRGFADRLADRHDPAALYGAPLIGEIPAFEAQQTVRSDAGPAGGNLPVITDPHSAVAEAFRFAASFVERIRAERGPRLSLVFVSPLAGADKSMVVANLALAIADGGTRVLVVDADADDGDLTARLLPGTPAVGGLEQVLAGQQPLANCIQPTPVNGAVAVLGSGPPPERRATGAARSKAASTMLAAAKSSFDVVLIDSPALLQVADATEVVDASDAAIIVLSPDELIRDHLEMVDRLKLIGSDVVGCIYNRAPMPPQRARYRSNGSSVRPVGPEELSTLSGGQPLNGGSGASFEQAQG
jgi:Mrp family chromosome partitioning ATPase/O-antigen/teichoic acid export membrane protein